MWTGRIPLATRSLHSLVFCSNTLVWTNGSSNAPQHVRMGKICTIRSHAFTPRAAGRRNGAHWVLFSTFRACSVLFQARYWHLQKGRQSATGPGMAGYGSFRLPPHFWVRQPVREIVPSPFGESQGQIKTTSRKLGQEDVEESRKASFIQCAS